MLSALTFALIAHPISQPSGRPQGTYEKLDLPGFSGMVPSEKGKSKVWTGKVEMLDPNQVSTYKAGDKLDFKQVGDVQVAVTDFSGANPMPTSEQILRNHELGTFRNPRFAGAHLRKTVCNFGETKVLCLDGSLVFNSPQRVIQAYLITFAFVDGTKIYQFQAITWNQAKYENLLVVLDGMKFGGTKVSGWITSTAGTFSIDGSPFSIKSPKALFPVLGEKADETLAGQYIGAVNVPQGNNYRYVLASLKENDTRTDAEILAVLARIAINADVPQGFKLDPKSSKGQFGFMDGTVKKQAGVEFRRKGRIAVIVAAARVPTGYPFGGVELVESK